MKKFFAVMAALMMIFTLAADEMVPGRRTNWSEKIALYLPNRILDLLDIFTVTVGVGPVVEARLMGTRLADVGAGYSAGTYKLYKDFNRQYGIGLVCRRRAGSADLLNGRRQYGAADRSVLRGILWAAGAASSAGAQIHHPQGHQDQWYQTRIRCLTHDVNR